MVNSPINASVDDKTADGNALDRTSTDESAKVKSDSENGEDVESVESLKRSMTYKNQPDSE